MSRLLQIFRAVIMIRLLRIATALIVITTSLVIAISLLTCNSFIWPWPHRFDRLSDWMTILLAVRNGWLVLVLVEYTADSVFFTMFMRRVSRWWRRVPTISPCRIVIWVFAQLSDWLWLGRNRRPVCLTWSTWANKHLLTVVRLALIEKALVESSIDLFSFTILVGRTRRWRWWWSFTFNTAFVIHVKVIKILEYFTLHHRQSNTKLFY